MSVFTNKGLHRELYLSSCDWFFFIFRVRIIFAGDDVTDEDAITALKGMAMTLRIVNSHVRIDTIT